MICRICDNMACLCANRDRPHYYDDEDYMSRPDYGSKNRYTPRDIHVMNSDEAKMCRKLMADTGLTEKELREHKKYRVMLSDAQKEGSKETPYFERDEKRKKKLMKQATKSTGLAKEHPDTIKIYNELCKKHNPRWSI